MGIDAKKGSCFHPDVCGGKCNCRGNIEAEFSTIAAFDNSVRDPDTGVGIPPQEAVEELKTFMNVNKQ